MTPRSPQAPTLPKYLAEGRLDVGGVALDALEINRHQPDVAERRLARWRRDVGARRVNGVGGNDTLRHRRHHALREQSCGIRIFGALEPRDRRYDRQRAVGRQDHRLVWRRPAVVEAARIKGARGDGPPGLVEQHETLAVG